VSFTTARSFPFDRLAIALNSALPSDISVRECAVVDADFSARFSAMQRRYVFAILRRREASALLARYAYHVWRELEIAPMLEGARHLLGTHDFTSFCGVIPTTATPSERSPPSRSRSAAICCACTWRPTDSCIAWCARSPHAGRMRRGRRDPGSLPDVLAARTRTAAGHTAPPQGLYLAGVRYPDGYDSFAEPFLFAPPGTISPSSR